MKRLSASRSLASERASFEPSTESSAEADVEAAQTEMWNWYLERTGNARRGLLGCRGSGCRIPEPVYVAGGRGLPGWLSNANV